ncbi:fibrobacter succinogenes major paralogous domain-containing protein [Bacteroidota bacterium]
MCYYNNSANDESNTYGALYNRAAAMNDSKSSSSNPSIIQGVCPSDRHLPSDSEWIELTDYLGGVNVAGGKMKETGTTHWESPNTGATNESGFTALPGGYRIYPGDLGKYAFFWSSTESSSTYAFYRGLYYYFTAISRDDYDKNNGYSIRCVKDLLCTEACSGCKGTLH